MELEQRIARAAAVLRSRDEPCLERSVAVGNSHHTVRFAVAVVAVDPVCRDIAIVIEPAVIADPAPAVLDRVFLAVDLDFVGWTVHRGRQLKIPDDELPVAGDLPAADETIDEAARVAPQ